MQRLICSQHHDAQLPLPVPLSRLDARLQHDCGLRREPCCQLRERSDFNVRLPPNIDVVQTQEDEQLV